MAPLSGHLAFSPSPHHAGLRGQRLQNPSGQGLPVAGPGPSGRIRRAAASPALHASSGAQTAAPSWGGRLGAQPGRQGRAGRPLLRAWLGGGRKRRAGSRVGRGPGRAPGCPAAMEGGPGKRQSGRRPPSRPPPHLALRRCLRPAGPRGAPLTLRPGQPRCPRRFRSRKASGPGRFGSEEVRV